MRTRTYVRYFGANDVAELRTIVDRIETELAGREPHMGDKAAIAARSRILMLKNAIDLMDEPVAEALGG